MIVRRARQIANVANSKRKILSFVGQKHFGAFNSNDPSRVGSLLFNKQIFSHTFTQDIEVLHLPTFQNSNSQVENVEFEQVGDYIKCPGELYAMNMEKNPSLFIFDITDYKREVHEDLLNILQSFQNSSRKKIVLTWDFSKIHLNNPKICNFLTLPTYYAEHLNYLHDKYHNKHRVAHAHFVAEHILRL